MLHYVSLLLFWSALWSWEILSKPAVSLSSSSWGSPPGLRTKATLHPLPHHIPGHHNRECAHHPGHPLLTPICTPPCISSCECLSFTDYLVYNKHCPQDASWLPVREEDHLPICQVSDSNVFFIYVLANIDSCLLVVMAFDRYVAICDPFHYVTIMNRRRCVLLVALLLLIASCPLTPPHTFAESAYLLQLSVVHHFLCDISPLLKLSCSSIFVNDLTIKTRRTGCFGDPLPMHWFLLCANLHFSSPGSPQLQGLASLLHLWLTWLW